MQTKKQSFTEALVNTFIGFVISYASTFIIFPLMGFNSSPSKNIMITLFFTVVSIFRGYVIRRFFNSNSSYNLKKASATVLKYLKELSENCPRETKW